MSLWEAIVLGIVQGLTEFLPVSSSGHLELGKALFGLKDVDLTFSILVHGATACSTLVVFRKDIAKLIAGAFTSDVAQRTSSHTYIFWLALSTLPAVAVAFTLRDFLEEAFLEHPHRVGWSLCATALILYASERIARNASHDLTWSRVLGIGLAQALGHCAWNQPFGLNHWRCGGTGHFTGRSSSFQLSHGVARHLRCDRLGVERCDGSRCR